MKRYLFIGLFIIFGAGALPLAARAETGILRIHFDKPAIQRGYTAEFNQPAGQKWGDFRLAIVPGLVNEPINLEMKTFNGSYLPDPENLNRVSDYYIFDILRENQENKEPLRLNKPFILSIKINGVRNYYRKRIYYWSKPGQTWVALPSSVDYDNGYVRAYTHLPFSRVAVFEDTASLENRGVEGVASWYRSYKYRYGAASNDYPIGTKLRIRNVDNGRVVDVEVVSSGPFLPFSARRVLDITLPAFERISERWKGVARVQAWPIGEGIKVLGVDTYRLSDSQAANNSLVAEPLISSKAAVAISEKTDKIIYSKNYDLELPIASLTKLMTASVFLDTNTNFDKIVAYNSADDDIGSRLRIYNGETVRVRDLYYSMLVGSANNAANALARSTGLSREEFVRRMNAKAQSWGLSHTHFFDVNGLNPENKSTVYEVALMAKHALNDFRILQGTTTPVYSFKTINTGKPHIIKSTAKGVFDLSLVDHSLYITGMKTGYLDEAGYCFMLKARKSKNSSDHVISVVLGASSSNQRYEEINQLIKYGLSKI